MSESHARSITGGTMTAGATRRVEWRERGTAYTAVARRHNGRSELQYVRRVRVTQRHAPERETQYGDDTRRLPAKVARHLEVEQ